MTYEEAINAIKCNYPPEHYSMLREALDMAIEALQKQIPKKPVLEKTKGIVGIDMWHCPVCDEEIISDWNRDIAKPYCHLCGQRLNWRDEE